MTHNKKLLTCICVSVIFALIIGFVVYVFNFSEPPEFYIFQSIDECERLIPTEHSDYAVEKYNSPDKDKELKNLSYEKFWGMNYESDDLKYEIFAYEFKDSDSALRYFINVTGKDLFEKDLPLSDDDKNEYYSSSKGMFSYDVVVVCQNKAYRLTAPVQYANDIKDLLKNTFTYQL